jgi:hypothetical protein
VARHRAYAARRSEWLPGLEAEKRYASKGHAWLLDFE